MSSIFDGIGNDGVEQLDENLRKWFKEKWVRFGPDGKIRGACARGDDSEGKPKCLPQKKAQNLGKKGRKYAASKKRREDPNPERTGKAKNVATKKKTNEGVPFDECPKCRGPIVHESMMNEKQDACYHKVKSRYKVWPSAYASGALVQCRKKGASNWGTGGKKNESSIMKGIVNEEESVLVLYIDGKPSAKYAIGHEAKTAMERLQAKFPNKKFELKREMREAQVGEAKAKPYVKPFIENGKQVGWKSSDGYHVKYWQMFAKDSAIKHAKLNPDEVQEDYTGQFAAEKTPTINPYGGLKDNQFRGAISEEPTNNPTGASGEGGLRKYKPKPAGEIEEAKKSEFRLKAEQQQYATLEKIANSPLPHWAKEYLTLLNDPKGKVYKAAYYSFPKGQEARAEVAQYIMDKYKVPKEWITKVDRLKGMHVVVDKAEDRHYNWDVPSMHEDTAYAGGMGQGGNAGQSYRKFKPKSAGTFKEEQLDEKCWDTHKQVGMKKKGGKSVPNCVPKESAIMKGIKNRLI